MKIALVTGASSGLGREFVRQIAEQGKVEEIWAIARRRDRLEALQSISAVPIRVLALDLTRPGDMEYLRNTCRMNCQTSAFWSMRQAWGAWARRWIFPPKTTTP